MPTGNTTLLGLALPVTGELSGAWGDTVNNSITSLLDSAIAGATTLSTDVDVTLSTTVLAANQARQAILLCSGARTALRTVTAPGQSKIYTVINKTTGGYSVKLVGSVLGVPTTGVLIAPNEAALVSWNGSDFVKVGSSAQFASSVSGTSIDLALGVYFYKTISANTTFTLANVPASGTVSSFYLELTNAGAYTTVFWSGIKWADDTPLSLTPYGTDLIQFISRDGGTTWEGKKVGSYGALTLSNALSQGGNVYGGQTNTVAMVPDASGALLYAVSGDWSFATSRTSLNKNTLSNGWTYDAGLRQAAGGIAISGLATTGAAASIVIYGGTYTTLIVAAYGKTAIYSGGSTGSGAWLFSSQLSGTTWGTNSVISGTYGVSKHVIGGTAGKVAYSVDDGFNWTTTSSLSGTTFGSAQDVTAIVYNTGSTNYCAIGSTAGVGTSSDGITWTYQAGLLTAWTTGVPVAAAYANGIIMVVGQSGKVATSTDGVTWTNQAALAATSWSTTNPASYYALTYTGTAWVVTASNGTTATSTDNGVTWTTYTTLQTALGGTTPIAPGSVAGVCRGASGSVMAYGFQGLYAYSADNGATWTQYEGPSQNLSVFFATKGTTPAGQVYEINWNGTLFMAVGGGIGAATSYDGVNWTVRNSGLRNNYAATSIVSGQLQCVAYGGGIHMAAGANSRIWTSSNNGVTWTYLNTYYALFTNTLIQGLAYGNSRFVGIGSAARRLMTTDNGATWSTGVAWATSQGNGIAFGAGVFVAVGASSHVATSSDGITWTDYQTTIQATGFGTKDVWAIGFGNSTFVAIGISGVVVTSPDGATWTYRSSLSSLGYGTSAVFYDVTWTGTEFVAVGTTSTSATPIMATSPDGITWTDRTAYLPNLLRFGTTNPILYAVGSNGTTTVMGGSAANLVIR